MELSQTLASVPLLSSLDAKTIKRLAQDAKVRTYEPGEVIIREEAPASALYIILSGRVRVDKNPAVDGEPLAHLTDGDFFGELALIEEHGRTATVVAETELTCLLISAWEFHASLEEHPEMAVPMLKAIIARLHRQEHHGN